MIDGKVFAKLCKDCDVISSSCTIRDVDLIFATVKEKHAGARKINYDQFRAGLKLCAEKRGDTYQDLVGTIVQSGGKKLVGTKAQANRFHDDKDLYTGVHANGGPSTVDTDKVADIAHVLDRGDADVRGTKVEKQKH